MGSGTKGLKRSGITTREVGIRRVFPGIRDQVTNENEFRDQRFHPFWAHFILGGILSKNVESVTKKYTSLRLL